ncbi:MAG: ankyrin repeat domain-containing protein [Planctomycetaceae bacterium]
MDEQLHAAAVAIQKADVDSLNAILASTSDLPALLAAKVNRRDISNHAIGYDMTLLQIASLRKRNDIDMSVALLDAGAEMDFHSACGLGVVIEIGSQLNSEPDLLSSSIDSYYPIQFAITASQVESMKTLLEHGDDPNRELKKVAYFGWEDDYDICQQTPWRPIHMASLWAFGESRIGVAQCLLDHGADLNAVSPLSGNCPLHLVAMSGRTHMIRLFAEQGVDVNFPTRPYEPISVPDGDQGPIPDCHDCTALMIAAAEGFDEATQCLLELGADANAKNSLGQTALDLAKKRFWNGQPYDRVIQLLNS